MNAVAKTMHRASRWGWLLAGLGIGYVLGTRAGRERYEQLTRWAHRTSDEFGVSHAVERISDSAKDTAMDLRDDVADRTKDALDTGSQTVSDRIQDVGARAHEAV